MLLRQVSWVKFFHFTPVSKGLPPVSSCFFETCYPNKAGASGDMAEPNGMTV